MVGLGETEAEVIQLMDDLFRSGVQVLTIGQYLQPTADHMAVKEYITPEQFERYRSLALQMGFDIVESSPLVRSSYHSENHVLLKRSI
jgi:lipoic acid synthetase